MLEQKTFGAQRMDDQHFKIRRLIVSIFSAVYSNEFMRGLKFRTPNLEVSVTHMTVFELVILILRVFILISSVI